MYTTGSHDRSARSHAPRKCCVFFPTGISQVLCPARTPPAPDSPICAVYVPGAVFGGSVTPFSNQDPCAKISQNIRQKFFLPGTYTPYPSSPKAPKVYSPGTHSGLNGSTHSYVSDDWSTEIQDQFILLHKLARKN